MFKSKSNGKRIRGSLEYVDDVLLQFQQKGSYRLEDVLAWLEWVLPRVNPSASQTVVVLIDWYAPHLSAEVDAACASHDSKCSRIGGGITPDVQGNDTHVQCV